MNNKNTNKVPSSYVGSFLKFLQNRAHIIIAIGAFGSVVLVLLAGRNSKQYLLQLLFAIWVFSPFGILWMIKKFSKRWSAFTQSIFYGVIFFISVSSLVLYMIVGINPPSSNLAFPFLIIPFVSWLFILLVLSIANMISRKL
jgi:hypothetical protein